MITSTKIYTLNCNHNIGRIGLGSVRVEQPICSNCNRTIISEIKYSQIEFEFDEYHNEDMFSSMGCIIVSKALFDALEKNKIKGFAPLKVKNKKSKYFEGNFSQIGVFVCLAIFPPPVKNIPIAYEFDGLCNECGFLKIDSNSINLDLMLRESNEDSVQLKVYHDSWNGNDIFNFWDHSEIGVSKKFLDVIKDFYCPDNIIIPAEWI